LSPIPKAGHYFKGDINDAVIRVQKETGVHIDPVWWDKNVGNDGTAEEIIDRFDAAYERDFGDEIEAMERDEAA
jgi:hypothetical protein